MSWKNFTPGQILTAADANTLMNQGRIIVANVTERNTIPATEGMSVYRLDTKRVEEYTNGAWRQYDTGWQNLTLDSAAAAVLDPSQGFGWRREGNTVSTRGLLTPKSGNFPTSSIQLFTFPASASPTAIAVQPVANDGMASVGGLGVARVNVAGDVHISAIGSVPRLWFGLTFSI